MSDAVRQLNIDRADVKTACSIGEGLSDWEVEFVESLAKQVLDDGRSLSIKQRVKLSAILSRCGR